MSTYNHQQYYKDNREHIRQNQHDYYLKNRERILQKLAKQRNDKKLAEEERLRKLDLQYKQFCDKHGIDYIPDDGS